MLMFDIKGFINQSMRVMHVATRPRQKEFEKIVKVTMLGVIIVGMVGVVISFLLSAIE